jgi:hypothetical protein
MQPTTYSALISAYRDHVTSYGDDNAARLARDSVCGLIFQDATMSPQTAVNLFKLTCDLWQPDGRQGWRYANSTTGEAQ